MQLSQQARAVYIRVGVFLDQICSGKETMRVTSSSASLGKKTKVKPPPSLLPLFRLFKVSCWP